MLNKANYKQSLTSSVRNSALRSDLDKTIRNTDVFFTNLSIMSLSTYTCMYYRRKKFLYLGYKRLLNLKYRF